MLPNFEINIFPQYFIIIILFLDFSHYNGCVKIEVNSERRWSVNQHHLSILLKFISRY